LENFVDLLNSKKLKIRELQRSLQRAEARLAELQAAVPAEAPVQHGASSQPTAAQSIRASAALAPHTPAAASAAAGDPAVATVASQPAIASLASLTSSCDPDDALFQRMQARRQRPAQTAASDSKRIRASETVADSASRTKPAPVAVPDLSSDDLLSQLD
jgi:hypothetical protein